LALGFLGRFILNKLHQKVLTMNTPHGVINPSQQKQRHRHRPKLIFKNLTRVATTAQQIVSGV
jgi:hypothetical protein